MALFAEEYSQKVSAAAGLGLKYGAFKASFNAAFTTDKKVSSSQSFATRRYDIILKRQYFDFSKTNVTQLKTKYLNDIFNKDINDEKVPALKIFNQYGTHLLLDIRLGGRMELNFMHEKASNETESTLGVSLEASYKYVSGSTSTDIQKKAKEFSDSSVFHCSLIGGSVSTNISTMDKAQAAYDDWANSLDPSKTSTPNLEFIGAGSLDNPTAMLPVWLLANTLERQNKLKTVFSQQLKISGGYFKNLQDKVLTLYVKDIYIGYGDSSNEAESDVFAKMSSDRNVADRRCINKDLNSGAGGKHEYLGYSLTTNPNEAIRELRGKTSNNDKDCKSSYVEGGCTYTQLHCDLNKDARGAFVYLYWTKDKNAGKPLLEIDVQINKTFQHSKEASWSIVPLINSNGKDRLNTNRGTSSRSDNVYVWTKKEL